jgi:hypothetical protein
LPLPCPAGERKYDGQREKPASFVQRTSSNGFGRGAMETVMSKQASRPVLTAAAAIAGALSIATPAPAHVRSHASETPAVKKTHAAKTHVKRHYQAIAHKEVHDVAPGAPGFQAWNPPGCTWPYTRMAPPCMSTWPPDDPNFHGYNR